MSEAIPKIYGQIAKIMNEVGPIAKDQKNQQQHFNYRGIDKVYNAVHPLFAKYSVFSTSTILEADHHVTKRASRSGEQNVVHAILKMRFTFWTEDGSSVATEVIGEGIDYGGDKASNKAMSIADKYAILQLLKIPTAAVDPDADDKPPEPEYEGSQELPRGEEHPTADQIKECSEVWKQRRSEANEPATFEEWQLFVESVTGRTFHVRSASEWMMDEYKKLRAAVAAMGSE